MTPLFVCLLVCACCIVGTWTASVLTDEYSWVDRIWSIAPIAYAWIFAGAAGFADPRLNLMGLLVTLWGARLTFNYARKGGYRPYRGEDYRWAVLRERLGRRRFGILNAVFIAGYQNLLILAIVLPAHTVHAAGGSALGAWDAVLAVLFLLFLAGETVADQQQWDFQRRKAAELAAGRTPSPRFVQSGLFRYSRHPNFCFKQAQWWVFAGFAVAATGSAAHWTLLGAPLLTLLFIGSTVFTESITRSRYPEYDEYRARTSMLVPLPPRRARVLVDA